MKLTLVYQSGIANVFQTFDDAPPKRLLQHSFNVCEWYCRGARQAGAEITVAYCNEAGDITHRSWATPREHAPFTNEMHFDN